MNRTLKLLALLAALPVQNLCAQPGAFNTIEKMKMRWDLVYKLKPEDVVKYQIDTISAQKVSSFNVAEAGSESTEESTATSRVYLTQKVLDTDAQGITTLEFTYDNIVLKQKSGNEAEQVIDTSGMAGRTFTVRISTKGKVLEVEGSGDTEEFKKTIESLFIAYPDKTLKIGDDWDDKREDTAEVPEEGLQIVTSTAIKYGVKDFEEYQRRDAVVLKVNQQIDQQLTAAQDDPGGTITSTRGQGTGKGTNIGELRVDAKTGQVIMVQLNYKLKNSMTVDQEQLVGPTIRTKYNSEVTVTTNTTIQ